MDEALHLIKFNGHCCCHHLLHGDKESSGAECFVLLVAGDEINIYRVKVSQINVQGTSVDDAII